METCRVNLAGSAMRKAPKFDVEYKLLLKANCKLQAQRGT